MDHLQIRRLRFALLFVPSLMASVALAPTSVGAAEEKASPATVAAGLQKIQDIASGSAKAVGKDDAKAEQLHGGIEPVWEKIEATVRANDSASYVALEDNFTLLKIAAKAADPSKASTASDSVSAAVDSYLAKHPGGESTAAEASSGSRSAAAAESSTSAPAAAGGTNPDNLPRTGSRPGDLSALAGAGLGLGGLALIGGARRRVRQSAAD